MQNPDVDVEICPNNAYYLVMTHSHALDMQLVACASNLCQSDSQNETIAR